VGNQAHDAVVCESFGNVSQGDWQMQLSRAVLVNSGGLKIPEGKRVATRGPKGVDQSLSPSISQSVST
jgi:hypothetical protein